MSPISAPARAGMATTVAGGDVRSGLLDTRPSLSASSTARAWTAIVSRCFREHESARRLALVVTDRQWPKLRKEMRESTKLSGTKCADLAPGGIAVGVRMRLRL